MHECVHDTLIRAAAQMPQGCEQAAVGLLWTQLKTVKGIDLSPGEIAEARKRFAELLQQAPGALLCSPPGCQAAKHNICKEELPPTYLHVCTVGRYIRTQICCCISHVEAQLAALQAPSCARSLWTRRSWGSRSGGNRGNTMPPLACSPSTTSLCRRPPSSSSCTMCGST